VGYPRGYPGGNVGGYPCGYPGPLACCWGAAWGPPEGFGESSQAGVQLPCAFALIDVPPPPTLVKLGGLVGSGGVVGGVVR
jgi:hypothetical protein